MWHAFFGPTVTPSIIQSDLGVPVVPQIISRCLEEVNLQSKCPSCTAFNTKVSVTPSRVVPGQSDVKCHRLAKHGV